MSLDSQEEVDNIVLLLNNQLSEMFGVAGEAQCVIVLTETELVAIDLTTDGWPLHRLPYLHSLSTWSAVTCVQHVAGVSDAVWSNLVAADSTEVGHWSTKVCSMLLDSC